MIRFIYLLFFILIILNIYYTFFVKYSYLKENFTNNNEDENNNNELGLIKYSSIETASKTLNDIYKLQTLLDTYNKYFYMRIIDTQINNLNDLVNKINENVEETMRKTSEQYLNDNIYTIIYPNIDLNDPDVNVSILYKVIIIYPDYYEKNNKLIKSTNTKNIFKEYIKINNFGGNTMVYKLDKNYKIFNRYLQ